MVSFAQKIARQSDATIYHIEEATDGDVDMDTRTTLLAVAPHKCTVFEKVMESNDTIRAEDYGRVVYQGLGVLSERAIQEILEA
ncbi:MAG: hypothetical protein ACN2B6_11105 [Rickettsiales bacterium]